MRHLFALVIILLFFTGCATKTTRLVKEPTPVAPLVVAPAAPSPAPYAAPPTVTAIATAPPVTLTPLQDNTAPLASTPALTQLALLLPLKSPAFVRPAEMVRQGFMAAMAPAIQSGAASVAVYSSTDNVSDILSLYNQALVDGQKVIVGPLTKNAVAALAASNLVTVPTLALNVPDTDILAPPQFYVFGLSADLEARQVAKQAYTVGYRGAKVIYTNSPLSRRMLAAFSDTWQKLGASLVAQLEVSTSPASLMKLKEPAPASSSDMLFLALDAREARLVRPYLDNAVPTYATSQVYGGMRRATSNFDLDGVRFLDMPWLLQPQHPAVMIYPRPATEESLELERFYALGIDAARLATLLASRSRLDSVVLDGVTGQISLSREQQFVRELVEAEFFQGHPQLRAQ